MPHDWRNGHITVARAPGSHSHPMARHCPAALAPATRLMAACTLLRASPPPCAPNVPQPDGLGLGGRPGGRAGRAARAAPPLYEASIFWACRKYCLGASPGLQPAARLASGSPISFAAGEARASALRHTRDWRESTQSARRVEHQ
jgi:hypothetical protein